MVTARNLGVLSQTETPPCRLLTSSACIYPFRCGGASYRADVLLRKGMGSGGLVALACAAPIRYRRRPGGRAPERLVAGVAC